MLRTIAGAMYGSQCNCGNAFTMPPTKAPADDCNMPCPGCSVKGAACKAQGEKPDKTINWLLPQPRSITEPSTDRATIPSCKKTIFLAIYIYIYDDFTKTGSG
jgi:hypothetical protein